MWSHYSNNHQGFVVGFDSKSLSSDYDFDVIEPIKYQEKYPLISGNDDTDQQFYKKFFSKAELWKYQEEWRISKNHIANRTYRICPSTITQIILGCRMDSKAETKVIEIGKKSIGINIEILRTIKSEVDFQIEFEKIN